jgi:hypothetical protein
MKDKSSVEKNKEAKGVKRTKIVVGLDIGTTKIACFVGKKNEHGKIEILSMGKSESLGVMRGVVANIQKTIQSINAAVKETQRANARRPRPRRWPRATFWWICDDQSHSRRTPFGIPRYGTQLAPGAHSRNFG